MLVACGNCERDMEVSGSLSDGSLVRCPFCGETSVFSKPSRIELPPETSAQRQMETVDTAEPKMVTGNSKKPLKFVAPQKVVVSDNPDARRIMQRMEDHFRYLDELDDKVCRRKRLRKIVNCLVIVALMVSALGTYGYFWRKKEKERQDNLAYMAEKARLEAERAEQERQERMKREAEEKERRARLLAERQRQEAERKAERQRQEAERKAERQRQETERKNRENEIVRLKAQYKEITALFRGGKFAFDKAISKSNVPGKSIGEFYFLLPFLDNREIVICQSLTNGIESVWRLDENGMKNLFGPSDTFLASLEGKDYLFAFGKNVYFHSKRKKPHIGKIDKRSCSNLSKEFFGDVAPEVMNFRLCPDTLQFEIVFVPKDSKKIVVSETVRCGEPYSLEKVRDAVEDAFPMSQMRPLKKDKTKNRFKRTVVFWDGTHIKRGVDGITYVPRVAPPESTRANYGYAYGYGTPNVHGPGWNDYYKWKSMVKDGRRAQHSREHWQSLYDEAVRQEEQEREYYEKRAASRERRMQEFASQAEREYSERIDRIIEEGTLYFRAKIENDAPVKL